MSAATHETAMAAPTAWEAYRPAPETERQRLQNTFIRLQLIELFVVLVVVRVPQILTVGRLWAEEGTVYFNAAWNRPWYDALFTVHTGYLNLAASGATLLALHLARLEYVPLVTTGVALALQVLPAAVLATGGFRWLERWPAFAAALVLLLIPGGSAEVWLNSITSQFHLALCVGLILAADATAGRGETFRRVILVIAPLAGPLSGTLAPFFLLRAALERSRARLVQTALLAAPMVLQTAVVLTHPEPGRSMGVALPLVLSACGLQYVLAPLAGMARTWTMAIVAYHAAETGGMAAGPLVAAVLGFGVLGFAVWRWGDRSAIWLFVAGTTFAIWCNETALTVGHPHYVLIWIGDRYTFASTVLLTLSLLSLAVSGPPIRRLLPGAAIAWVMLIGAWQYFQVPALFGPAANWQQQVAIWRHDPAHQIQIWPKGWMLPLNPSVRPRS